MYTGPNSKQKEIHASTQPLAFVTPRMIAGKDGRLMINPLLFSENKVTSARLVLDEHGRIKPNPELFPESEKPTARLVLDEHGRLNPNPSLRK